MNCRRKSGAGQGKARYNATMQGTRSTGVALVAAFTITVISMAALRAQQPPAQQPPAGGAPTAQGAPAQGAPPQGGAGQGAQGGRGGAAPEAAPPARPIVPASASSIAAKPEAYYGQVVTIYATVEEELAPTAFSVDQDKTKASPGKEVLVLAPRLHEKVQPNSYVTVIGEVVHADPSEISKKAKPNTPVLPAEVLAKHPGRPVILASSVIDGSFNDLAKFIPPPMTPEEAALDKTMKGVGGANGALRKGVDAMNADLVKTNTDILVKAFTDTEAFWKARGKADAVKIAQTAHAAAQAIQNAAAMGNWNEAKAQNTTLGQQCAACHGVYRERGEDGSFYIKPGTR
jgi:cytochrome c556